MRLVVNRHQVINTDLGVFLRRRERGMSEEFLDGTKVGAAVEKVGGEWKRSQTLDVVGIDKTTHSVVLGSALWRSAAADPGIVRDLIARTSDALPKKGSWSVYYLGFSAGGWTEDAPDLIEKMIDRNGSGKNWRSTGFKLLDLDQVDADLRRWSNGSI